MPVPTFRPPIATVNAAILSQVPFGPRRRPTSDETLDRLLVRNVFLQDREDRVAPQIMDRLVALVWYGDRYVPAIIPHPTFTPLDELERLHRPVPYLLFEGRMEDLQRFAAPPQNVRGRCAPISPVSQDMPAMLSLWLAFSRRRNWRRKGN